MCAAALPSAAASMRLLCTRGSLAADNTPILHKHARLQLTCTWPSGQHVTALLCQHAHQILTPVCRRAYPQQTCAWPWRVRPAASSLLPSPIKTSSQPCCAFTAVSMQACVPAADVRMAMACETCGVELARLPAPIEPKGSRFQLPEVTGQAATAVILGVPALLLGAAYLATQIGAHLRVGPAML